MIGVSEAELKQDREKFLKFIKNNPYPSYDFVSNELILKKNRDFDQFAEYGTQNHEYMKEIYENIFDSKLIKKNGKAIFERGGMQTLHMNYETLLSVVSHLISHKKNMSHDDKILILYNIKDIVSSFWNGVGDWRH